MLMLVSAPVGAQERDRAAAEALFRAGREAAGRGDYATACQRFEESNRLEPTAGTVMNLANCREQLGQIASAWQRYREAIEKLPAEDERVGIARERSAEIGRASCREGVEVSVVAESGGAYVRIR